MSKRIKFGEMVEQVRHNFEAVADHRSGENSRYTIADAGLSALSAFFMQSPSFLAHQRDMVRRQGQSNLQSLFDVEQAPSDGQIRNLLDPVAPSAVFSSFWWVYDQLQERGHLDSYRGVGGSLFVSLDGATYFSSQKIHCPSCRVQVHDETVYYTHPVLSAVLVSPHQEQVIALAPEFILPQDGHDKQDCEQEGIKRWVQMNHEHFEAWELTVTTDDLHSHQPLCQLLLAHKVHFLMTAKPQSHEALTTEVGLLKKVEGGIQRLTTRRWNGRFHEESRYRWTSQVPLRATADALPVNWCEVTLVNADSGERLYHNSWITSHAVNEETVVELVAAARAHWKVENEAHNVLKNQGYHFDHNFGHGHQHLSTLLLTLLLFAFLMHTVLHLTSDRYRAVRAELGRRRTFFNDLRALTRYHLFSSWHQLITFMYQRLDLAPD